MISLCGFLFTFNSFKALRYFDYAQYRQAQGDLRQAQDDNRQAQGDI